MNAQSLAFGPRTPEKVLSVLKHPQSCTRKRVKSSMTQPGLFDFAHILYGV